MNTLLSQEKGDWGLTSRDFPGGPMSMYSRIGGSEFTVNQI